MPIRRLLWILTLAAFAAAGCGTNSDDEEVVFTAFLPLTGELSFLGDPGRYALEIANEKIAAEGGILGRELVLDFQDTKGSPSSAGLLFTRLPSAPEDRTLLTTLSGVSSEIARRTSETEIPTLQFVLAIHPDIIRPDYSNVRICYNAVDEARVLVEAVRQLSGSDVAALVSVDAVSAAEYEKHIRPSLEEEGVVIKMEERFNVGESDFRPLARRVASERPSIILVLGYGSDFVPLVEAIKEFEELSSTVILGGIGFVEVPAHVDTRLYQNIFFAGPAYLADPEVLKSGDFKSFVAAYEEKAGQGAFPPYDAIFSYDSIMLWRRIVEEFGSSDPVGVLAELRKLSSYEGLLGEVPMRGGDAHPQVDLLRFSTSDLGHRFEKADLSSAIQEEE